MFTKSEEIAHGIIKDYEQLSGLRSTIETQWNEIAQRVSPIDVDAFQNPHQKQEGEKKSEYMYDSTAAIGLGRFMSIMDSYLTPRNSMWHRLAASDPYLKKNREATLWFEEATRILFKYRYAPTANFAAQNQQVWRSLGAYGTGCNFIDELFGTKGLRYKNIHLGELFLVENHQGVIDKVIRRFALTARQAYQQFGDALPEGIKNVKDRDPNRKFLFFHCVKPREDRDPGRADYKGMQYAAYYVSEEGKKLLKEEGYNTFPYCPSRYEQLSGMVWGYSPAMAVLPAIKTLNEEKKTVLKQGQRTVDPIYLMHDDGVMDMFSARPGSQVAGGVSAEGRPLVHTLPVGNIAVGKDLMDDERLVINDAFLVTLFQILVENPQMTATEVLERTREKGVLVSPTMGRQHDEYLGRVIERELDILAMQGALPPMPGILKEAQGEYTVVYDSPLTKAQRAEEASGLMRTLETTLNVVNVSQNLEPLDHFDWDIIVPEISDIQGVPMRWMRDPKIIAEIRTQRQAQQETQEMIQAGPAAAAMTKAQAVANKGRAS
jgi:hypothetical protein